MINTKLSICIVSFNALDYLKKCLDSIYKSQEEIDFEVIVVDNNSQEDNVFYIKKHFPQIKLISNLENNYFASANNQAFSIAKSEYILLLNPDTEITSGSLTKMVRYLDKNQSIGVLGPKLLNSDGSLQVSTSHYLTIFTLIKEYSFFYKLERVLSKDGQKDKQKDNQLKTCFVDSILGACLLVRKKVINDIGPLDEYFKFYAEEMDFLFRTKEKKWQICYFPQISIFHHSNKSAGQNKLRRVKSLQENLKSQYRFIKKHRNKIEIELTRLFLILVLYLKIIGRKGISFMKKDCDRELLNAKIKSYKDTISWLLSESDTEKMNVYNHFTGF